jgi:hydrogenase/urease accessory protein HupE
MAPLIRRWVGPILAVPGLLAITVLAMQDPGARGMVAGWVLTSALSVERVAPLLGLGVALALLDRRRSWSALAIFVAGAVIGFKIRPWFMATLDSVPQAAAHLFLTGPISNVTAGLLLLAPRWARNWLFAPVALVMGALLAVATGLTDPTVNGLAVPCAGVAIGVWIVAVAALAAGAIDHPWFVIAARIAGSWLLAAGLLYGSTALIPRRANPDQPVLNVPPDGLGKQPPGLDLKAD